jgi:hypothetical protein
VPVVPTKPLQEEPRCPKLRFPDLLFCTAGRFSFS